MVQKAAWGLFQEAHEDDKLLTNDELEALRAEEADGESKPFTSITHLYWVRESMVGCHGCRGHDGQSQQLCTVAVPASHDERVYEGRETNTCLPATTTFF